AGDAAAGPSFGALLKDAIGSVVESGRKSDAQAQALAAGKANIVDVGTAVSETEIAGGAGGPRGGKGGAGLRGDNGVAGCDERIASGSGFFAVRYSLFALSQR